MNDALKHEVDKCKALIASARAKPDKLEHKLVEKLDAIENHMTTTQFCEKARLTARLQILAIKDGKVKSGATSTKLTFHDAEIDYFSLRANFLCSYLSASWGIYDNLAHAMKAILKHHTTELNGDTLQDVDLTEAGKKTPTEKLRTDLYSILNFQGVGVLHGKIGPLRSKYRYRVALYYQIRNSFLHGAPLALRSSDCFAGDDISDFFLIRQEAKERLDNLCLQNSGIKPSEIENGKIWSEDVECIFDLITVLENEVDTCAALLLEAVFLNLSV